MVSTNQTSHTPSVVMDRLFLLIRHAESEKNRLGYHGHHPHLDHPLTPDGLRFAESFARSLKTRVAVRTVVASCSLSTKQTAQAIADQYGLDVESSPGLRAVSMGAISGVTDEQIRTLHPEVYEQLRSFESGKLHPNDLTIPGKEEFADFAARTVDVIANLATKRSPAVVVAHHSVLTMLVHILSAPGGNVELLPYRKHSFPHLSVTIVESPARRQPDDAGWYVRGIALTLQQAIDLLDANA